MYIRFDPPTPEKEIMGNDLGKVLWKITICAIIVLVGAGVPLAVCGISLHIDSIEELKKENSQLTLQVSSLLQQSDKLQAELKTTRWIAQQGVQVWTFDNAPLWEEPDNHNERVPPPGVAEEARSGKWPRVRAEYFAAHSHCEFKGCTCKGPFNVHHIVPFHEDESLELDPHNLITLCAGGLQPDGTESPNHHLWIGHLGNFRDGENPNVREDCKKGHWPKKGLEMKRQHDAKKKKTQLAP